MWTGGRRAQWSGSEPPGYVGSPKMGQSVGLEPVSPSHTPESLTPDKGHAWGLYFQTILI